MIARAQLADDQFEMIVLAKEGISEVFYRHSQVMIESMRFLVVAIYVRHPMVQGHNDARTRIIPATRSALFLG